MRNGVYYNFQLDLLSFKFSGWFVVKTFIPRNSQHTPSTISFYFARRVCVYLYLFVYLFVSFASLMSVKAFWLFVPHHCVTHTHTNTEWEWESESFDSSVWLSCWFSCYSTRIFPKEFRYTYIIVAHTHTRNSESSHECIAISTHTHTYTGGMLCGIEVGM